MLLKLVHKKTAGRTSNYYIKRKTVEKKNMSPAVVRRNHPWHYEKTSQPCRKEEINEMADLFSSKVTADAPFKVLCLSAAL